MRAYVPGDEFSAVTCLDVTAQTLGHREGHSSGTRYRPVYPPARCGPQQRVSRKQRACRVISSPQHQKNPAATPATVRSARKPAGARVTTWRLAAVLRTRDRTPLWSHVHALPRSRSDSALTPLGQWRSPPHSFQAPLAAQTRCRRWRRLRSRPDHASSFLRRLPVARSNMP
ncbi:LAQU0S18e00166g1_1 [Lachancea quebecensis]|uniref:LAQU0S18e00166g1_1 n=1 Tax=Lachancea quebecensis TaxID=1654605 RepID=A0A0P1KXF4_9SACH|nr:LAQU0S18e00166g1_1 [Lachancea quebecensis]